MITKLKAYFAANTEPWCVEKCLCDPRCVKARLVFVDREQETMMHTADAELIVQMRVALPALLAAAETLEAIRARFDGEFDHPSLVKMGPLSTSMEADMYGWVEAALKGLK